MKTQIEFISSLSVNTLLQGEENYLVQVRILVVLRKKCV